MQADIFNRVGHIQVAFTLYKAPQRKIYHQRRSVAFFFLCGCVPSVELHDIPFKVFQGYRERQVCLRYKEFLNLIRGSARDCATCDSVDCVSVSIASHVGGVVDIF